VLSETISVSTIIEAPTDAIFAVLADPRNTRRSMARAGSANPSTQNP
jgi:hypothetical protein